LTLVTIAQFGVSQILATILQEEMILQGDVQASLGGLIGELLDLG
jgi:hypothetical protein